MPKKKFLLIILSLFLVSCSTFPTFPEIWQCGFKSVNNVYAFYCVNNRTKEREKRAIDDPRMDGAQAVSLEDFKKIQAWQSVAQKYAKDHCK